jgi:hypothetical protein
MGFRSPGSRFLFDLGMEIADFSGKGRETGSAEIVTGFV